MDMTQHETLNHGNLEKFGHDTVGIRKLINYLIFISLGIFYLFIGIF